jgi:hypothetical protein
MGGYFKTGKSYEVFSEVSPFLNINIYNLFNLFNFFFKLKKINYMTHSVMPPKLASANLVESLAIYPFYK